MYLDIYKYVYITQDISLCIEHLLCFCVIFKLITSPALDGAGVLDSYWLKPTPFLFAVTLLNIFETFAEICGQEAYCNIISTFHKGIISAFSFSRNDTQVRLFMKISTVIHATHKPGWPARFTAATPWRRSINGDQRRQTLSWSWVTDVCTATSHCVCKATVALLAGTQSSYWLLSC